MGRTCFNSIDFFLSFFIYMFIYLFIIFVYCSSYISNDTINKYRGVRSIDNIIFLIFWYYV